MADKFTEDFLRAMNGKTTGVSAPAVSPSASGADDFTKQYLAAMGAGETAAKVQTPAAPYKLKTIFNPDVEPAATAKPAASAGAGGQTTVAPKNATFWEKIGSYLSGSTDTTLPNVQANESSELIGEQIASGAVDSVKGLVNNLGYYGQGAMRGKLAGMEAQQRAQAAVTGSNGSAALADNFKTTREAQEKQGLTNAVNWGTGLKKDIAERSATADPATLKIAEVAETVGGMLPSIAANAILPGSGLAVMGMGAAGNATEQSKAEGASDAGALTYGTTVGAIEAATEKMFDGVFGVFGKGVADDAVEKLVSKYIKGDTARNAVLTLTSMLGEGAEEFVAEVTENWANRITANTDQRRGGELLSDAGKAAAMGALVSALFQGAQVMQRGDKITAAQIADNAVAAIDGGGAAQNTQNTATSPTAAQEVTQGKTGVPTAPENEGVQREVKGVAESAAEIDPKDYAAALEAQREIEAGRAEPDTIRDTYTPRPQSGLHIDDRGYADVSSRKVNAFQFDNPELHQHFVDAAGGLLMQLNNTTKGERFAANLYFSEPDRPGGDSFLWTGTKRDTSPEIERLLDNANLSYAQIRKAIDDLIADHGQENYAAAKKVELILDEMLTDGFEVEGEYIPADGEYIRKKEAIKNGENPNGYNMSEEEWNSLFANEYNAPEENKGNDDGIGAKTAKFGYDEAETQTHSSDGLYTETERTQDGIKAEDRTHKVNHDAEVDEAAAQRYEFDYEGEKADLFSTKQDWDDADTVLAHKILANEVEKARKSGSAEAWKEVARLQKVWDAQGTTAGQAFRQRGRFANTPDAMVAEAANVIYGEDADTKLRRLSPQRKAGIMETVKDMADRYNAIEAGDTASLVSLIKRLNEIRKTTGLFSNKTSKQMEWALDWYAKNGAGGETLLRDVAAAQIRNIAGDYARLSPVEAAKNYRIAGMLSKVSTIMRNLISNNVIDPLDSLSNNLSVPLDSLLSKYTKTRSVAVDKSWASKAKRAGSLDGAVRSFIQVGLDADVTDSASKYEQRSGRVFKMAGNPIERLLSTWSKMEGYALQTTDEFQKGGIKAETQRGLNELAKNGAVGADYAGTRSTEIAKQRTFQNDGALSNMMLKGRDALNSLKITDKQGGTMGAGDVLLPFAKVPANVTAMLGNYSPLGLAKGMLDVGRVIAQAKSGTLTPELQAKAVTGIGRGMTGSTALAGFVALALKGILNVGGSDDKDEDALQKSSGVTGTQMNLSALERWIAGKSTEWQDGDKLVSIGFLEPLNGLMAAGSAIADSYAEDHEISLGDIANASVDAVFQSVIDLPAMSSISNLINSYKYSKADTTSGKIGDALGGYAAGQASSFLVPNFVGGIAAGTDNTVRDAYSGETGFQQAVDGIKLKIPGLRQTLPAKLDNFGNPRTYTGNTGLNFLNSNIFPGQIANYKTNAVVNELTRLDGTDIGATFPDRAAPNSINRGAGKEKMTLTADEKYRYQQTYGQYTYKQLDSLFKSTEYKAMSDEEKAKAVSDVYSAATVEAKRKIVEGRGEMYLPTDGDVKKVDGYKAAGLSEDKAYSLYKAMDALVPETGKSEVSSQQKAKVVVQQGYDPKQTAVLVGSLWNQSGAEEKKTLLPSLNVAQRLVTMYVSGGDSKLVSMTVPRSFSENNVAYTLTDAEMELFQTTYADYFNRNANNVMSEENLLRLREDAYNRAKYAVLRGRK